MKSILLNTLGPMQIKPLLTLTGRASQAHNLPMLLLHYTSIATVTIYTNLWVCPALFIAIGGQYFHLFCLFFTLAPVLIFPRLERPSLNFPLFRSFLCKRLLILCYIQKVLEISTAKTQSTSHNLPASVKTASKIYPKAPLSCQ